MKISNLFLMFALFAQSLVPIPARQTAEAVAEAEAIFQSTETPIPTEPPVETPTETPAYTEPPTSSVAEPNPNNIPQQAGTWPVYFEVVLDEARGRIYGSDSAGAKIDVIRISDLKLIKSISLPGTAPKGIALSPDGSELAVANYGIGNVGQTVIGSILFVNPVSDGVIATIIPEIPWPWENYNRPWDVVYGRPGRLYSVGNPDSSGNDFIHVIDTATYVEISRSSSNVRMGPTLSISSDKSTLYFMEPNQSPKILHKVDVTSDTLPDYVSSPHADWLQGYKFVLSADETKIFTDSGEVWSSDLRGQIGSTGQAGNIALLPTHDAIAVAVDNAENDAVSFYRTSNYYGIKKYTLPVLGTMGPMIALSDGSKLFVTSSSGITAIDLSSGLPGSAIPSPTGSLPYFDLEVDEARGVLYGSDSTGHKIDVISMDTLQVTKRFRLVNGATPKAIALSPDGSELAVAEYGASTIIFLNPSTGQPIDSLVPDVDSKNMPWGLVYGRVGRLYSVGNLEYMGLDYIHVIDTVTHIEVGKSIYPDTARMCPSLTISSDNNNLYIHESCQSPQKIRKFDITTDTPIAIARSPHASWLTGANIILSADDSKIFTDSGQVWNSNLIGQIGSTGQSGNIVLVPNHNVVAVTVDNSGNDAISFYSPENYYGIKTYILPALGTLGPIVVMSDGSKLFVSSSSGITAVVLPSGLPGSPIPLPTGTQPYFDLEMDEARGVLYGSDPNGHKIDVISMTTMQVTNMFRLANGATPTGIALSPDGNELAVAEYGASSIAFLDLNNSGQKIASVTTNTSDLSEPGSLNLPWDVIYGRPGRLYSTGAPTSYGLDYLHVIDTVSYTEIGRSDFNNVIRNHPTLAISTDKNALFVDESYPSTHTVTRYNVSTDLPEKLASMSIGFVYQPATILLLSDQSKILTSAGQVLDFNLQSLLGTFVPTGKLAEIPSHSAFLSVANNQIVYFDAGTYSKIGSYEMASVTSSGPAVVKSDDSFLFVTTNVGIKRVSLSVFPPIQPHTLTVRSTGARDGMLLESEENSNKGGSAFTDTPLYAGDDSSDCQYRSILDFNTATLPNTAIISKVTLRIKKNSIVGTDPFTILGYLTADIRSGYFGARALEITDFQNPASKNGVGRFYPVIGMPGWYQLVLSKANFPRINLTGITQFRLRFTKGDNDNRMTDHISFYSGDTSVGAANRPVLIIEYMLP